MSGVERSSRLRPASISSWRPAAASGWINSPQAACVVRSPERDTKHWMEHHPTRSPVIGDAVPQVLRVWPQAFRPHVTGPTWQNLLVLVMGALLAPGKRTVSACLRMTGRADATNFTVYHQVLNRGRWKGRALARTLLMTRDEPESDRRLACSSGVIATGLIRVCSEQSSLAKNRNLAIIPTAVEPDSGGGFPNRSISDSLR